MKYLSVCAGIEAATVAWHHMGWEPVAFSEIEKFPSAVLAHHYPNVPNWGDMTKFKEWPDACLCRKLGHAKQNARKTSSSLEINGRRESNADLHSRKRDNERRSFSGLRSTTGATCNECNGTIIDVLVGGTPCQSFSVAGLRKGLADPRGNLMLTFGAIAQRYRPEWLVWENVPGVLSSNGGRDFGAFLGMLAELGYGFAYRVLDAQYFGVPQRRRRVFVCAVRGTGNWQRAAAVLFERHSLSGHPAPSRQARKGTASGTASGTRTGGWPAEVSPTLNACFGSKQGQENQHINGGAGMFVPVAFDAFNQAETGELSKTVASRNDQDTASLVAGCWWDGGDVAATITTKSDDQRMPDKANAQLVLEPVAIQGTLIGRGENAGPQGSGADVSGAMFTLKKTDVHAMAFPWQSALDPIGNPTDISGTLVKNQTMAVAFGGDIARSLTARHDSSPCADRGMDVVAVPIGLDEEQNARVDGFGTLKARMEGGGFEGTVMTPAMQVRRLTPVECERLQGFPDGYTNIPWRGKPESPDGPRYKALGNSMAVPVMSWIGERINEVSKL